MQSDLTASSFFTCESGHEWRAPCTYTIERSPLGTEYPSIDRLSAAPVCPSCGAMSRVVRVQFDPPAIINGAARYELLMDGRGAD